MFKIGHLLKNVYLPGGNAARRGGQRGTGMTNSDDRRAKRSRRLLKQGLQELLLEKQFSDISVRDITDRMDLNRGTFYLHYPDTYALLQSLEDDVMEEAQKMVDQHRGEVLEDTTLRPIFGPILDYIVENRELCTSLFVNNASSNFVGRVNELIDRNGSGIIRGRYPGAPEEELEYVLSFISFGLIGLIKKWFDEDMRMDKEQLLDMADQIVNTICRARFKRG